MHLAPHDQDIEPTDLTAHRQSTDTPPELCVQVTTFRRELPAQRTEGEFLTLELHGHIGFGPDQDRNLMLATEGHSCVPPKLPIQQETRHGDARREAILDDVDHFLRGGAVRVTGRLKGLGNLETLQQRNGILTEPDQGRGGELMAQTSLGLTAVVVIDAFHRPSGVGHHDEINGQERAFWRVFGATLEVFCRCEGVPCHLLRDGTFPQGAIGDETAEAGDPVQLSGDDAVR
ncbi:hypothetical protein [Deinococcus sp. 14RED07]|uniref:hypothetical protein n=1 Tax=Deinococcus sp. 14RED07 TaxID=2745874 RepID=UPI001E3C3611|nr:hypothetical protein [Deinococcus sp. 14RED07]